MTIRECHDGGIKGEATQGNIPIGEGLDDFSLAANLYRAARNQGVTIRQTRARATTNPSG